MANGDIRSIADLEKNRKNLGASKGRWRFALLKACERIEDEDGVEGPEPKPVIDKLAYRFIKACLNKGDIAFYKELGDRLDGKPAQAVELGDANGKSFNITLTATDSDVL